LSVKDILGKLERLELSVRSIDDRLKALEEREKSSVSPNMQSSSEATERSLMTVRELTREPEKWVSIEVVANKTGRSTPTESGYLRYLYQTGRLDRRARYVGEGEHRRRIFEYRAKA
jgi:response regulator of citrate/malate metabolism